MGEDSISRTLCFLPTFDGRAKVYFFLDEVSSLVVHEKWMQVHMDSGETHRLEKRDGFAEKWAECRAFGFVPDDEEEDEPDDDEPDTFDPGPRFTFPD